MMKISTMALILIAAMNAKAGLFGVKLVSATEHPTVVGQGLNTSAVGAIDGGLISGEIYSTNSYYGFYQIGAHSSASDYFDIQIDAYWLQTSASDSPPSQLYLNRTNGGSSVASSYLEVHANGGTGGTVTSSSSATAGKLRKASSNSTGHSTSSSDSSSGLWTTADLISVSWIVVGSYHGLPVWKTNAPIAFSTPTVAADGSCYLSGQPGTSASAYGMSTAALGVSHRLATSPIPIRNLGTSSGGGGTPPAGGGGGGTPPGGGGGSPGGSGGS